MTIVPVVGGQGEYHRDAQQDAGRGLRWKIDGMMARVPVLVPAVTPFNTA